MKHLKTYENLSGDEYITNFFTKLYEIIELVSSIYGDDWELDTLWTNYISLECGYDEIFYATIAVDDEYEEKDDVQVIKLGYQETFEPTHHQDVLPPLEKYIYEKLLHVYKHQITDSDDVITLTLYDKNDLKKLEDVDLSFDEFNEIYKFNLETNKFNL